MASDALDESGKQRYRFEILSDKHKPLRTAFSCGEDALDEYLRRRARQDMSRGLSVVHILHDNERECIAGHYTLSSEVIERGELPGELEHGLGRNRVFPAVLLGRLAMDLDYQGEGLGAEILLDALYRALDLSQTSVGIVAVLVDPIHDKAQKFYARYGFKPLNIHQQNKRVAAEQSDPKRRLYLPMKSIQLP